MTSGDQGRPIGPIDIEGARIEMNLDLLERAGWLSGGGRSAGTVGEVIYRQDGRYMLSPGETAIRLGLIDGKGVQVSGYDAYDPRTTQTERFGYDVETDPNTGDVVIGYSGPDDERYQKFFEDLLALGHDLNYQQEAEIGDLKTRVARYVANPIFRSGGGTPASEFLKDDLVPLHATNKLMRQLVGASSVGDGTIQALVATGMTKSEAIAGIVRVVAPNFLEDTPSSAGEAIALERWLSHVEYRYTKVVESLQAHVHGAELDAAIDSNPVVVSLRGIGEGIRLACLDSIKSSAKEGPTNPPATRPEDITSGDA